MKKYILLLLSLVNLAFGQTVYTDIRDGRLRSNLEGNNFEIRNVNKLSIGNSTTPTHRIHILPGGTPTTPTDGIALGTDVVLYRSGTASTTVVGNLIITGGVTSGSTPILSTTGAYTWSGAHTWSNNMTFNGTTNTFGNSGISFSGTGATNTLVNLGLSPASTPTFTGLNLSGSGVISGNLTVSGYLQGAEMTAPGSAAANGYRIYAEDNGSGKTRLMVKFATGAAQQIAIEP